MIGAWQRFAGRHVVFHIVLGGALALLPVLLNSDTRLQTVNLACICGIAALGLNVVFGLGGLLSIAQAAIMAVGGYVFVFVMGTVLGVIPSIVLVCLGGAAVSSLTGLASARVRSHYFILLTLALAEALILLIQNNPDLTGGSNGLPMPGDARLFGWDFGTTGGLYSLVMPLLLASWYLADCFKRSRPGLALRAFNADDYLALMSDIATGRARFAATAIGGAFAGLAGALLVIDDAYIGPQSFDFDTATLLLLMIVLGGPGSNAGTVVAATILTVLLQGTLTMTTVGPLIYGVAIMVLIIVAPEGLAGLARSLAFGWRRRAAQPASPGPAPEPSSP